MSKNKSHFLTRWQSIVPNFSKNTALHWQSTSNCKHSMTFEELDKISTQWAHYLHNLGITPCKKVNQHALNEPIIAIYCGRNSPAWIIALLAAWKAGAAVLLLDKSLSTAQILGRIEDSIPKLLVTDEEINWLSREYLNYYDPAINKTIATLPTSNIDYVDKLEYLAYIAYTSGTESASKGVAITHQGILSMADSQQDILKLDQHDRVLQASSLSFDAVYSEFFSLLTGASLVLPYQSHRLFLQLDQIVEDFKVTTATIIPSALRLLNDADFPRLKNIVSTGEAAEQTLYKRWYAKGKRTLLIGYGPTEVTIGSMLEEYKGGDIYLGKDMQNCYNFLVDEENNRITEPNVKGEIIIKSYGLARGYIRKGGFWQEETDKSFISITKKLDGKKRKKFRAYRTKDLGYWTDTGELVFSGRLDRQYKISGKRIEALSVEHAVMSVIHEQLVSFDKVIVIPHRVLNQNNHYVTHLSAVIITTEVKKVCEKISSQLLNKQLLKMGIFGVAVPRNYYVINSFTIEKQYCGMKEKDNRMARILEENYLQLVEEASSLKSQITVEVKETYAFEKELLAFCNERLSLKLESFNIDNYFEELGITSLMEIKLIAAAEKKYQINLAATYPPLATKLTLRILAKEIIRRIEFKKSLFISEELSDKAKIICFPPISGSATEYKHLTNDSTFQRLNLNFVLLESPMIGEERLSISTQFNAEKTISHYSDFPCETLTEISDYAIYAMKQANINGPYALAGFSFGGVLAIIVASRLQEIGEKVEWLGLFDPSSLDALTNLLTNSNIGLANIIEILNHIARKVIHVNNFIPAAEYDKCLPPKEKIQQLFSEVEQKVSARPTIPTIESADFERLRVYYKTIENHLLALVSKTKIREIKNNFPVYLNQASNSGFFYDQSIENPWRPYFSKMINIVEINDHHLNLMRSAEFKIHLHAHLTNHVQESREKQFCIEIVDKIRHGIMLRMKHYEEYLRNKFVPLSCSETQKGKKRLELSAEVEAFIDGDKKVLLILGDSGAGKTSTCYDIVERQLQSSNRLPLYIPIGELTKIKTDSLERYIETQFDLGKLELAHIKLHYGKKIILIIDGYDEKNQLINYYKFFKLYEWNAKVIITCRTQFLLDMGIDYKKYFTPIEKETKYETPTQLTERHIQPLSKEQRSALIYSCLGDKIPEIERSLKRPFVFLFQEKQKDAIVDESIQSFLSATDLINNPLFLSIVLSILPELKENQKKLKKVNRAIIYEMFLNKAFQAQGAKVSSQQEIIKQNSAITDIVRDFREYCKHLAFESYQSEVRLFSPNPKRSFFQKSTLPANQLMQLLSMDMPYALFRAACPLKMVDSRFTFIHESLRNFFIALYFVENLFCEDEFDTIENCIFNKKNLNYDQEVKDFIAALIISEPKKKEFLLKIVTTSKSMPYLNCAASNAISTLVCAKYNFSRMDLSSIHIDNADLEAGNFYGTNLTNASMRNCILRRCNLTNSDLTGANLKDAVFDVKAKMGFTDDNSAIEKSAFSWLNTLNFYSCSAEGQLRKYSDFIEVDVEHCLNDFSLDGSEYATAMSLSPDSSLLAISKESFADYSSFLYLFDLVRNKKLATIRLEEECILALKFSIDNLKLAIKAEHETVIMFDLANAKDSTLTSGKASLYYDKTCSNCGPYYADSMNFSENSKLFFNGEVNGSVTVWKLKDKIVEFDYQISLPYEHVPEYLEDEDPDVRLFAVGVSPNLQYLAAGGYYAIFFVYALENKTLIQTINFHSAPIYSLLFDDTEYLYCAADDGNVSCWSLPEFHLSGCYVFPESATYAVEMRLLKGISSNYGKDNNLILAEGETKNFSIVDFKKNLARNNFQGHSMWINGLNLSENGELLASIGNDAKLLVWSLIDYSLIKTVTLESAAFLVWFPNDFVIQCVYMLDCQVKLITIDLLSQTTTINTILSYNSKEQNVFLLDDFMCNKFSDAYDKHQSRDLAKYNLLPIATYRFCGEDNSPNLKNKKLSINYINFDKQCTVETDETNLELDYGSRNCFCANFLLLLTDRKLIIYDCENKKIINTFNTEQIITYHNGPFSNREKTGKIDDDIFSSVEELACIPEISSFVLVWKSGLIGIYNINDHESCCYYDFFLNKEVSFLRNLIIDNLNYLAIGTNEGILYLFDIEKREVILSAPIHTKDITEVFYQDGKLYTAGYIDKTINIWQLDDNKLRLLGSLSQTFKCKNAKIDDTIIAPGAKSFLKYYGATLSRHNFFSSSIAPQPLIEQMSSTNLTQQDKVNNVTSIKERINPSL